MVFFYLLFLGICFLLLFIYLFWKQKFKKWSHLPGPFSPLMYVIMSAFTSNIPLLMRRLYKKYQKDGLCFLPLIKVPLLLVGDFKTMKKLLIHPGSQGRFEPNGPFFKFIHDLRLQKPGRISGVILSQGETWKEQRTFMVKTLNTLGLRGSSLEKMVMEEVGKSCDCLGENDGQPVQVVDLFKLSVINILWKMTTGENVNNNDTKLRVLCDGLHAAVGFLGTPAAIFSIIFPWIVKVFPNLTELKVHKDFYSFLSQEIQDLIETHKDDLDVDNPKDLIDHFLIKIGNYKEELTFLDIEDQEEKLRTLIIDVLLGGESTTSDILSFGLSFLVAHPKVQRMVQEEIDSIVGDASPTMEHGKRMPYTQATIREVLRYADIVPLDYRCTTEDVLIDGVIIPKDTIILNIVTEVMKGTYWQEGETFNPGRFMDGSKLTTPDERFIPFLMGKRSCPGQNLANMQLFLYFTRILQLYDVNPEVEGVMPKDTFIPGIISSPMPFKIRFCSRKS